MNLDIKRRWIELLRSNTIAQGIGYLRSKQPDDEHCRYCCLGVLCELHRVETNKLAWGSIDNKHRLEIYAYQKSYSTLPDEVVRWAGLEGEKQTLEHLAALNDQGLSFFPISEVIQARL